MFVRSALILAAVAFFIQTSTSYASQNCNDFYDPQSRSQPQAQHDLLAAAFLILNKNPASLLSKEIRIELAKKSRQLDFNSFDPEKLRRFVKEQMTDENSESLLGSHLVAQAQALKNSAEKNPNILMSDERDMGRDWGWKVLPENDPIFDEPEYLALLMKARGASGLLYDTTFFSRRVKRSFDQAWRNLAPQNIPPPQRFTLTGSDANNLFLSIAEEVVEKKQIAAPKDLRSDKRFDKKTLWC